MLICRFNVIINGFVKGIGENDFKIYLAKILVRIFKNILEKDSIDIRFYRI